MKANAFWVGSAAIVVLGAVLTMTDVVPNKFWFFAAYVVLQYVVLATAWNIMGGYMGYVNFGSAGFFAIGAYTSVALFKLSDGAIPLPVLILAAGVVCGLIGLGTGYLTLRLRGVFFAIATLALAIVLETLVINWEYVGGASGAYLLRPRNIAPFGDYVKFLFFVMLVLAVFAVAVARWIERSKIGRGLTAIRDDELAAEHQGSLRAGAATGSSESSGLRPLVYAAWISAWAEVGLVMYRRHSSTTSLAVRVQCAGSSIRPIRSSAAPRVSVMPAPCIRE